MKWYLCDREGRTLAEPLPTLKAVRKVIRLYPVHYLIAESETDPGRIVEVLMLR